MRNMSASKILLIYRTCATIYARSRGLRLNHSLNLTPRRLVVFQNYSIQTRTFGQLRKFSMEATTESSEPKLESPPVGNPDETQASTTCTSSIHKSDESDVSHDEGTRSHDPVEADSLASDERYAYLQKGFTTEIYKIEINNLPHFIGYQQIKKKLKSLDLKPVKLKMPTKSFCFVNFRSDDDREAALKVLNGYVWKKKTLTAKAAAPAVDPLFKRKRKAEGYTEANAKRPHKEEMSIQERLAEAVTPLLQLPYSEQLTTKHSAMAEFLRKAAFAVQKKASHPGAWFTAQVEENGGKMCPLEPIRPSPVQTGYRNKCEFSVGISPVNKPVVGFRVASYEEGDFTVVSPDSCVHIPQRMKDLAKIFQDYFCKSSLPTLNPITEQGNWRQVAVRCFRTGETTAVVQMHPQQLTQEEVEAEKKMLADYFSTGEGSKCCPTSLFFQRKAKASEKPANELILGEEHIHETLLGMKFRVSPDAFFQVNVPAAEVVYSLVQELSSSEKPSIIYDICCGTGTIGLFLAKTLSVRHVVGVEMVEEAVEDAKVNAQLNGVNNAEFLCGKAEDVLPKHLEKSLGGIGEVVGVVDPPRGGLHPHVVQVIRRCFAIERLVYISCNPGGALGNFVDLCQRQSNRIKGTPFRPVKAIPVDLFPHTKHCELVVLFERVDPKLLDVESSKNYPSTSTSEESHS